MVAVKRSIAKTCGAGPTVHAHASPAASIKSKSTSLKSSSSAAKSARSLRQKAAGIPTRTTRSTRGRIPRAAAWGWLHTPVPNRIMFFGVLFGLVSVTTPYWASVKSSFSGYASFGIWHFCIGDEPCSSIHENLLPGKRVPAWHTLVQGTFTIGVACSIVGLGFLTHCAQGMILKMSPITHRTTVSILAIAAMVGLAATSSIYGKKIHDNNYYLNQLVTALIGSAVCPGLYTISAFQHLVALYTFVTYFEDHDFLYDTNEYEKDFHGSFYCGVTSFLCLVVTTAIIMFDDDITRTPKSFYYYNYRPVSYDSLSSLESSSVSVMTETSYLDSDAWSVERKEK